MSDVPHNALRSSTGPVPPPAGTPVPFALLHHVGQGSPHYDLLVQIPSQETLLTWRLETFPQMLPPPTAVRIQDHRPIYLTYEGPISGGRGEVRRVAHGNATLLDHSADSLALRLPTEPPCDITLPLAIWSEEISVDDESLMEAAYQQALKSYNEGGLPIGSVLADAGGTIVARGHNLRVQTGDPTAHAEVVCIRNAGRRRDWRRLTLVSTLSPCIMCTGTSLLYRIPRVIIGENENFLGAEELFRAKGVELRNLGHAGCIELMARFIREKPDLWNEDIGVE